ncbi:hypothetical protein B0H21DRAFT_583441 [Amylocystis lapponica]|nr:hypothetical protein B0H21DRAFT_583441 [Amylocystis lapponica]
MFPFLPRKVSQAAKLAGSSKPTNSTPPPQSTRAVSQSVPDPSSSKGKDKGKAVAGGFLEEDCTLLLLLSLSEHTVWADPDLRRTIATGEEGFIPLGYLLRRSPFLASVTPPPTETVLVRSIRAHANAYLDVRMLVSAPSRGAWYGTDSTSADALGGYEVRRKDWENALQQSRNSSRHEWEARTLYMENIPLQHRTIAGIHRLTSTLLSNSSPLTAIPRVVQSILLPAHHQDKPDEHPKCKGFALVTLENTEHVELLLNKWPWSPRRTDLSDMGDTTLVHDAIKFGFRTLSKARWDALKEEYLTHRQRLLDDIAHAEDEEHAYTNQYMDAQSQAAPIAVAPTLSLPPKPAFDLSAPYPPGCLVYVRNVHAETNKTTLRTLFSQAFSVQSTEGLDYVDFNKGMETCYLRLATPQQTALLIAFFESHPTAQLRGLDNAGTPVTSATQAKALVLEVVDGTREELYWTKVPEKVRRQAVERSFRLADPSAGVKQEPLAEPDPRKRKRRRRDD